MAGRRRDRWLYVVAAMVAVVVAVISFGSGEAHAAPQEPAPVAVRGAAHLELAPVFLLVALVVALGLTWLASRRRGSRDDSQED